MSNVGLLEKKVIFVVLEKVTRRAGLLERRVIRAGLLERIRYYCCRITRPYFQYSLTNL